MKIYLDKTLPPLGDYLLRVQIQDHGLNKINTQLFDLNFYRCYDLNVLNKH